MSDNSNNSKVFVGRLPDGCTEKDLEDLFRTYGTVQQTDLIGKYGFVHMTKREEAEEAIKKLNNYNFMGSQLTVQYSTSKMNGNPAKSRSSVTKRVFSRKSGPYNRNNSYPPSQPLGNSRFAGPPNVMPYYDDINGYYREPYYPESDPYYPPNQSHPVGPPYEPPPAPPAYGRRGPPPPSVADYPRAPVPLQPDYYGRGDGPYNRPPAYGGPNRPIPPLAEPPRAMAYGAGPPPMRNGYGNVGYAATRGPAVGPGLANRPSAVPPPPPSARWQPY